MYRIEFSENADAEMINISDYIFDKSGSAEIAIKVVLDVMDRIEKRLGYFPNSGSVEFISEDEAVYRQIVIDHYYIIYRIEENERETFVLVTNVIHDARNKDDILTELDKR